MGLSGFNRRRELERQGAEDKQPGAAKEAKPAKAKPEKKESAKAPQAPAQVAEPAQAGRGEAPQDEQE